MGGKMGLALLRMHVHSVAPLFTKRLSAAVVIAWLLLGLGPRATRADDSQLIWHLFKPFTPSLNMHPAPVLVPEKVSSPPKTASEHPDASEPGRRSWFSGLKQADDIDIYGLMFVHPHRLFLKPPPSVRPIALTMQTRGERLSRGRTNLHSSSSNSATLQRPGNSATLQRPTLSPLTSPVLGQIEEALLDMAPVLMLLMLALTQMMMPDSVV